MRTLVITAIVAACALLPEFAGAHGTPTVAVAGHPHPDGPIAIKGTDFEPGQVVQLALRKQGEPSVPLGPAPVGDDGSFAITLHVPSNVKPALYELVASVGDETTSAEATVFAAPDANAESGGTAADGDVTNHRPADETVGLAVVTAALASVGGAIVLLERRHAAKPL